MSQVIVVDRHTGQFQSIDGEGKFIPETDAKFISTHDADVLMNRMVNGFIDFPLGTVVMRLELDGDSYDTSRFEITDLIQYLMVEHNGNNAELLPVRGGVQKVSSNWDAVEDDFTLTRVMAIDFLNGSVKYLLNPLHVDPFVGEFHRAVTIQSGSSVMPLLWQSLATIRHTLQPHEHLIPIITKY